MRLFVQILDTIKYDITEQKAAALKELSRKYQLSFRPLCYYSRDMLHWHSLAMVEPDQLWAIFTDFARRIPEEEIAIRVENVSNEQGQYFLKNCHIEPAVETYVENGKFKHILTYSPGCLGVNDIANLFLDKT